MVQASGSNYRMPLSEAPADVNEPKGPAESAPQSGSPLREASIPGSILGIATINEGKVEGREAARPAVRGSRWIDYDTHELLQMISELEDERRWARLREGALWALLVHIVLLFALILIPKYLLKLTPVVQTSSIKDQKDFTYLDTPNLPSPKPIKPLLNRPLIDKKMMDDLKRQAPPVPAPQKPEEQQPAPEQQKAQPPPPIPPSPQSQQPEAPRPQAVPAKPIFGFGSPNPAEQLRDDMRKAMQRRGSGTSGIEAPGGGLSGHPGAGTGQPDILSDTQGVDFNSWLARWHYITQRTWDPLIPDEVNPPILKSGVVAIRFKVLPNGQVVDMQLDGRSGDTGLDRAAWGAITGSSYPPLPREFHGPYLELRAYFLYNMQPR